MTLEEQINKLRIDYENGGFGVSVVFQSNYPDLYTCLIKNHKKRVYAVENNMENSFKKALEKLFIFNYLYNNLKDPYPKIERIIENRYESIEELDLEKGEGIYLSYKTINGELWFGGINYKIYFKNKWWWKNDPPIPLEKWRGKHKFIKEDEGKEIWEYDDIRCLSGDRGIILVENKMVIAHYITAMS